MKILCLCLLLFWLSLSAAAELVTGNWSGTYSFAEDEILQVKFLVAEQESPAEEPSAVDGYAITMNVAGVALDFSDIEVNDQQLRFHMNPGEEVGCVLNIGTGGVYKGRCRPVASPDAGEEIRIFMRPPPTADQSAGSANEASGTAASETKPAATEAHPGEN